MIFMCVYFELKLNFVAITVMMAWVVAFVLLQRWIPARYANAVDTRNDYFHVTGCGAEFLESLNATL